ncbi:MAG: myo-inositol 2-dehydrogenase/D-chiro-inositol 1-dehydrogenase [Rubritalea sp.]|jgi:myo-inositol 2-dehydrogenase/D-chiro-inositol 1-dehydrogenase
MNNFSRRHFVKSTAAIGALTSISAFGINKNTPNDKEIRIVLVGCGGRGKGAAYQAMNVRKGIKIVAVADAFEDNAKEGLAYLKKANPDQVDVADENVFHGFDAYKKAIDVECDLVILATPPHFRPIHLEYAVNKKKHVFMEKPVAVDGYGVRSVLKSSEIAEANGLMLAVGLQRHHQYDYREAVEKCQTGAIGEFQYARVWWNSSGVWTRPRKPGMSEMEYQMRNWYYFNWLCGDHIVEQHIHNLDVVNWVKGEHPTKCSGMGGREVRTSKEHGEIFDHFFTEYEYADGSHMFSQARHMPKCDSRVQEIVHGSKGSCDFGKRRISGENEWRFKGRKVSGHQEEWFHLIAALDKGEVYNEGQNGAEATLTAIMGRMASYSGVSVTWEDAMNSDLRLAPESYAWDANPPTLPDKSGFYSIPVPGMTKAF